MKIFDEKHLAPDEKQLISLMKEEMPAQKPDPAFKAKLFESIAKKHYAKNLDSKKQKQSLFHSITRYFHNFLHVYELFLKNFFTRYPLAISSILIFVIGFGATTTYAYISPEVTRYDNLYFLKKMTEDIQYSLALSPESKIQQKIHYAERRKQELQTIFKRGNIDQVTALAIAENLKSAQKIASQIQDEEKKTALIKNIIQSSKRIKEDLDEIIMDIEKEVIKDSSQGLQTVKKDDQFEEFIRKIENIGVETPIISCTHDCTLGDNQCSKKGVITCGNFDTDACYEWGEEELCPEKTSCKEGVCEEVCSNTCSSGEKRCHENGIQICGNYDNSECLDWGDVNECDKNHVCQNGTCIRKQPVCKSECNQGSRRCTENGYQICGNYDSDNCLEWGQTNFCPNNSTCNSGVCKNIKPSCKNECNITAERRCTVNGYQICGNFDADSCLEWGESNSCPFNTNCKKGICKLP